MSQQLERLGVELRDLQDAMLAERERAPVEERLARVHSARGCEKRTSLLSRPLVLAAASFVLTASVLFVGLSRPAAPLGVTRAGRTVEIGGWLESEGESAPLSFSEGTSFMLSSRARARLLRIDAHGAELALERGKVRASVVKREGARWTVSAGPFQILVTGTHFDASWDPEREVLEVSMQEGSVRVTGRCVEPKSLSAGESSTFQCRESETRHAPPQPTTVATPSATAELPLRAGTPTLPSAPASEWNALSREGRFKQALAAAEAEGFSSLCARSTAERVLELGNVARLAGNPARASEAFLALRQRFAGSGPAAMAAFHLGRMAFDGSRDYASSRRWFGAYLAEQPGGRFAEEALGRLMESEHRAGDRTAAEASADRYLARFPTGAHAALAQSLTGR